MQVELERKHSPFKKQAAQLLESFGNLARENGYNIEIHSERAWDRFDSYPLNIQKDIVERFAAQFSVITELNETKTDFRDPVQSIWRIIQKFNWKPAHDLFDKIGKSDVIEIYLPDQTPIYRNMGYFNYTSYTMTELLFFPWPELFDHQEGCQEKLIENFKKIFVDQSGSESCFFPPPYIGVEKSSKDMLTVRLHCKTISTFKCRTTNLNEAIIVVWDMEVLNKKEASEARTLSENGSLNEKEVTI